jgi:hypothetical protein
LVIFWQNNLGAKVAHEMLVKLTKVVNFTNILRDAFLHESVFRNFCALRINFCFKLVWQKEIGAKAEHKILVKLTSLDNFTNIL